MCRLHVSSQLTTYLQGLTEKLLLLVKHMAPMRCDSNEFIPVKAVYRIADCNSSQIPDHALWLGDRIIGSYHGGTTQAIRRGRGLIESKLRFVIAINLPYWLYNSMVEITDHFYIPIKYEHLQV